MSRIIMALLAIPLLAGGPAFARDDGSTGDYRYEDAWKREGTRAQKRAHLRIDADACRVRAGYQDDVQIMRRMSRDPAYQGCMQARGWRFFAYTPSPHGSQAGRGHHPAPGAPGNDMGTGVGNSAAAAAASQAQNDAAQAQFNQGITDSQQFMNTMNQQTPHE